MRRSPVLLVLSTIVSLVLLGGALAAPLVARVAGYERAPTDLGDVRTWDIEDTRHTDEDVDYPQTPPAGVTHAPVWLACGVYDVPVRDENAVHDLEHGTVWITHDPDLSDRDREALAAQLPDNGSCRRARACPHPSWSRCGVRRSPWTTPATTGCGSSSRSTATATRRRSSG